MVQLILGPVNSEGIELFHTMKSPLNHFAPKVDGTGFSRTVVCFNYKSNDKTNPLALIRLVAVSRRNTGFNKTECSLM